MLNKFSGQKVLYHPKHVKGTFEGRAMYPVHINVDTTNYCNHRCLWCSGYEGQQKRANDIDLDILLPVLRLSKAQGLKAVTHIGSGDPTMHKQFMFMTRSIAEMGLDQGMFTHGMYPNEWSRELTNYFTWIRFSLDAGSTEVHDKTHGVSGHYEKILENIRSLNDLRVGPNNFTIGVQFVVHQTNYHDLVNAARRVKEAGADYFSIKPVIKRGAVEVRTDRYDIEWDELQSKIVEAEQFGDDQFEVLYKPYQFQINNVPFAKEPITDPEFTRSYTKCYATNFEWWIRNNMDVAVCGPMHKTIGNLRDQTFESLLGSERYNEVINNIKIKDCYRGCRPHYLNESMHQLKDPETLQTATEQLPDANFRVHKNFVG